MRAARKLRALGSLFDYVIYLCAAMYFIDAWLYSIASVVAATVAAATARAHGLEERCGLGVARGRDQICNAVLLAELRGLLSGRDAA